MKNKILYPVYLAVAACFGVFVGVFFNFPNPSIALNQENKREQKLRQIMRYIDYEYVDDINTDSLLDNTISSLMEQLDPHSTYIPKGEVLATQESIQGSFVGIGIEFKIYRDSLYVVHVIEGGPSEKANIKAGQRILQADSVQLFGKGLNNQKVLSTLKGIMGSKVKLKVYDPLKNEIAVKTISREEVPVKSVQSALMLNDTTGFLKLIKFTQRSAEEISDGIEKLKDAGAKNLILDLRDNPGGLLSAAEKVADEFLAKNDLIVFTKDRQGNKNSIYASGRGGFKTGEVAVLINGGSASASEIVAGALQDNDRALIIGKRSFGKGLVQEEITLNDGSRLRLTTQRYYTPTGRSIQKDFDEYDQEFLRERGFHSEIPTDTNQNKGQEFVTPGGRIVYGGGGIKPDIAVAYDSNAYNRLFYHLVMSADLDEMAFNYVDKNRAELGRYFEDEFVKSFEVDSLVLHHFFAGYRLQDLSTNLEAELPYVKSRIKGFIAYNLFGNAAYQKVYSQNDPYIKEALERL